MLNVHVLCVRSAWKSWESIMWMRCDFQSWLSQIFNCFDWFDAYAFVFLLLISEYSVQIFFFALSLSLIIPVKDPCIFYALDCCCLVHFFCSYQFFFLLSFQWEWCYVPKGAHWMNSRILSMVCEHKRGKKKFTFSSWFLLLKVFLLNLIDKQN